jgi:hypothetical protein
MCPNFFAQGYTVVEQQPARACGAGLSEIRVAQNGNKGLHGMIWPVRPTMISAVRPALGPGRSLSSAAESTDPIGPARGHVRMALACQDFSACRRRPATPDTGDGLTFACTKIHIERMIPTIVGFDWDRGNQEKCQKRGVSTVVIESLFYSPLGVFPDPEHSDREERFKAVGRTEDGRAVLIVFTLRVRDDETLIRPISARYMRRKEIDYYEKEVAEAANRRRS